MKEGYDIVSGWRKDRNDTLSRRLSSKIANRIICWLTGTSLHDTGCTLKAYKSAVIKNLNLYGAPDREALARLFTELGFGALLAEYGEAPAAAPADYEAILDEAGLQALVGRIRKAGAVAVDTETDNISPTRAGLVGFSLAVEPGRAYYVPLRHRGIGAPGQIPAAKALDIVRGVLEDPAVRKTGRNIKYDLIVLEREGVHMRGLDLDTMILSYLLEPNWGKHNLDRLSLAYLGRPSHPL